MHPHNRRERELIGRLKGIKRAKGYWNDFKWMQDKKEAEKLIKSNAQIRQDTTKLCSCSMCGNPRHTINEETMQEIKDELFVESELEDLEALTVGKVNLIRNQH